MRIANLPPVETAPAADSLLLEVDDAARLRQVLQSSAAGEYLHWEDLAHRIPPQGLSRREWWLALKLSRHSQYRRLPLVGGSGRQLRFVLRPSSDALLFLLSERFTRRADVQLVEAQFRTGARLAEAIGSAVLAGADPEVLSKEQLLSARSTCGSAEQFAAWNCFELLQQLPELGRRPLDLTLLLELQEALCRDTAAAELCGRLRRPGERLEPLAGSSWQNGLIGAEQLEVRLEELFAFANGEGEFVHPLLRAAAVHYTVCSLRPCTAGSGRLARLLFCWCLEKYGMSGCDAAAPSRWLAERQGRYGRSLLYGFSDGCDVTYFVELLLEGLAAESDAGRRRRAERQAEIAVDAGEFGGAAELNRRQRALLAHALRHPEQRYTVAMHRLSHAVVYETARTDLLELCERGLLRAEKVGRKWEFVPTLPSEH